MKIDFRVYSPALPTPPGFKRFSFCPGGVYLKQLICSGTKPGVFDTASNAVKTRGFIVHGYADTRKDRLYLIGRLEDGRSFAASEEKWRPSFHIYESQKERVERILSSLDYKILPPRLTAFDRKQKLLLLHFSHYRDYSAAGRLLESSGLSSPDADLKPTDAFLIGRHIFGPVELDGDTRPGRLVDLVFPEPEINPSAECGAVLKIASVDIETDVREGTILAVGMSVAPGTGGPARGSFPGVVHVLARGGSPGAPVFFHSTEASLLEAFLDDIRRADPDVITGWNFLDFDFPRIAERCEINHIPFTLGRSFDEAKFFPSSRPEHASTENTATGSLDAPRGGTRVRSAAALVPGRQVLDALRIFRSGPRSGSDPSDSGFTLEEAAISVLGEGKLIASSGSRKIAELEELYQKDPARFGAYCLRDTELVLKILEKTGLWRLTLERASLTGVSLDKAWTSVVSFERVYGIELRRRGIAPVPVDTGRSVSGAAGGTVLEPMPGFSSNVVVFDFRSLYPTIMQTFNIDPLAQTRVGPEALAPPRETSGPGGSDSLKTYEDKPIAAPNGALFSREKGILPELIAAYFAARRRALDAGDEEASFVYKILMNSFYGVLGTPSCRYGRTELAGAITSFARKWLHFSRDWFSRKGYRVLYGDTDSLFVETGLPDQAAYGDFLEWGKHLAGELNAALKEKVKDEYGLESFMELRFEKAYRRFMIPPLRNTGNLRRGGGAAGLSVKENRGRAKGYGGYLLHSEGGVSVEVKGMEAVRSDYTPLARRVQLEFLELVFSGGGEEELKNYVDTILEELRQGKLDNELIYRKRLSRSPEAYTASTPPQVKAARALGWKNRRGTVEYVWTVNGPEPSSKEGIPLPHSRLDYDHYAETQILPAARSIAQAAGWKAETFFSPGRSFFVDGQLELGL